MFHVHTKKLAAIAIGLGLTLLPAASFAADPVTPAQTVPETQASSHMSIQDMRYETKEKISEVRAWAKDQKAPQDIKYFIDDMEAATDRLQDEVAPVGKSIKSFAVKNMPGKSLIHRADQSFTVFGILLMMALVFVFTLMSLSNPESRLGGRH